MKIKKELKWSVLLILGLFPLLALILLNSPEDSNAKQTIIEKIGDTSIIKKLSIDTIQKELDPLPEMMADGRYPQDYFKIPVDFDVYLSGTFGELRSNHFHSGLDIRTGGVEGKHVLASASGYVSRINVSQTGYGNVVYVSHPNGYTTVYAHLQRFSKDIQFYVRKHQYAKKTFEVELYPESGLLQVNQGDIIAYSGNTGGSGGPHLHFEIRKSNTSEPVNPLLFGLPVIDQLAPEILKLYIYKIDKTYRKQSGTYPFMTQNTSRNTVASRNLVVNLPQGTYAIGAFMKDYFRSRSENLGVNYSELYIDGIPAFECKIEKINFNTTRYINSHFDFCVHKTENKKTQKFYKDDGNKLDLYKINSNKGTFILKDTTVATLVARDLVGNKDSLKITFIADSNANFQPVQIHSKTRNSETCKVFTPGNSFALSHTKVRLTLPSNALYFNYNVCVEELEPIKDGYSSLWSIGELYVPIHVASNIALKVEREIEPKYYSKLLIVEIDNGRKYPVGGKYNSGFIETSVRNFGSYYIALDTIAPKITPIKINNNQEFVFSLSDNLSGIKSFNAYIEKQWLLMEFEPKTGVLTGKLNEALDKGNHTFTLKVKDERGNEAIFEKIISVL